MLPVPATNGAVAGHGGNLYQGPGIASPAGWAPMRPGPVKQCHDWSFGHRGQVLGQAPKVSRRSGSSSMGWRSGGRATAPVPLEGGGAARRHPDRKAAPTLQQFAAGLVPIPRVRISPVGVAGGASAPRPAAVGTLRSWPPAGTARGRWRDRSPCGGSSQKGRRGALPRRPLRFHPPAVPSADPVQCRSCQLVTRRMPHRPLVLPNDA